MSFVNFKKIRFQKGFTLVELLITIVIFVILTSVVLFNQNGFDNTVLLNNLTYDIALTIRQAQTYGVNTRESEGGTSGIFPPYGVFFNKGSDGSDKNIILFSDTDLNSRFIKDPLLSCPADDTECVQRYSIKRGNFIKEIWVGSDESSGAYTDKLTIMFTRPKPDAWIYSGDDNRIPANAKGYARITVSSADGSTLSSIIVTSVGQIYVQK